MHDRVVPPRVAWHPLQKERGHEPTSTYRAGVPLLVSAMTSSDAPRKPSEAHWTVQRISEG